MKQRYWQVISCGVMEFETRNLDQSYVVDVQKRECTCRLWKLNEYGCVHSVATLSLLNTTHYQTHVERMYFTTLYYNTYKEHIHGTHGMNMLPSTEKIPPLPPIKRRMPSRPTIKRKIDGLERSGRHTVSKAGKSVCGGVYKQKGHNKTTCSQVERPLKTNGWKSQGV
ncbi:uncharacterized protein LOC111921176 [Lactuca sativa]|uniref:uncharacterized protein LOC111921176 n=1 Tax=Lactuca sativa TaxID=4236 RepID=UPI000CD8839C|nr:uncharacterized protein LOC111921176 [Lactuca sativa]